jgi:hypothetical protein
VFEKYLQQYITGNKEQIDLYVQTESGKVKTGSFKANTYKLGICDFIFLTLKLKLKSKFFKRHMSYEEERILDRMNLLLTFELVDTSPE